MVKLLLIIITSFNTFLQSDLKQVANYYSGKHETTGYESFSFYITNENKPFVSYMYGKEAKEGTVKFLSKDKLDGKPCFKVLRGKTILYIIPEGDKLRIKDSEGKYNKIFSWQYEGPINGIGTWCSMCTQGEEESLTFLKKYYLSI